MTKVEIELLNALQAVANYRHDGHLTICKFTTNWRVGFITPNDRDDISELHPGETFAEAAQAALDAKGKKYEGEAG